VLIVNVSIGSRDGKGLGTRARYLAGLAAGALRRRFRELDGLPDPGSWRQPPTWTAKGPTERNAFSLMGLAPDERIPMAPLVQGHGSRGRILIALRGDAVSALGNDVARIERAVEASVIPTAAALGLGPITTEEIRVDHLMSNQRTHYRVPAMDVYVRWPESVEDAIRRTITHAAANMAYGHDDQTDRLLDLCGIGEDLLIEGYGEPSAPIAHGDRDLVGVSPVRFSVSGRLYGPLFMLDRPGRERPSVAMLDNSAGPDVGVAA
jgi:hypothetical protein